MMARRHVFRFAWISVVVIAAVASPVRKALAGKAVYVGERVAGSASFDQIDHSLWNNILNKYVDGDGMVDYRSLHQSADDRRQLRRYLNQLSTADPETQSSRNAKLAFWINAYNAVTVEGILQQYPTTSIRNHTAKVIGYNIWHDLKLYVNRQAYSLDAIEHKILRKMQEPRIHFAIVCASIGCPRLLNEAYVPKKLDQQLELNAKDFFARPQNFRHDAANGRFYLSAILDWFAVDFGASKAQQLKTISQWLPTLESRQAAIANSVSIKSLKYDWNLNQQ